jgi:hypothetical protein
MDDNHFVNTVVSVNDKFKKLTVFVLFLEIFVYICDLSLSRWQ